ncbi:MAG TPA: biotin/lipoyl-binding protein [Candidatus Eisenbacteria bacterium]|jgi:hypothetical protein
MLPSPGRAYRALACAIALALASCSRSGDGARGSGTIEMDEVDVASLTGGRLLELRVDEGDAVRAGDTIAASHRRPTSTGRWRRATRRSRGATRRRAGSRCSRPAAGTS